MDPRKSIFLTLQAQKLKKGAKMKPKLIIVGSAGRMGKRIIALAAEQQKFDIIAAVEKNGHPDIGKDAGLLAGVAPLDLKISPDFAPGADCLIDFSTPDAADLSVGYCLENNAALVLGTTGLTDKQHEKIKSAAEKIPVIYGTNMSVGMNVLFDLAAKTAQMLGDDYDSEIIEQHHRFKKDAPSGSALTLAENIAQATNKKFPDCLTHGRKGKDALRQKGTIGIHAVRAGDITGIHSVVFSTLGESVTLNHTAHNRDGFASGALRAADWLTGKNPGLYSMADCLGIK
jgi:4-hydroxy-tetrahydrodipicolinate reductase